MVFQEGELVLCTVEKILGTTVFIRLDEYNKVGVIPTSEIAPGRIRNIRDYVTIGKKIVCKILRIDLATDHTDLSLRRVSQKDTREILERYKKEKAASTLLQTSFGDEAKMIEEKIRKKFPYISEFFQEAIKKPELISELEIPEKLLELIKEKIKIKKFEVKAKISVSSTSPEGIRLIKEIFKHALKNSKISYLGAPHYLITVEDTDHKEANKKIQQALEIILKGAKEHCCKAEIEEE